VPDYSLIPDRLPNVVVVRSLTKSHAIPGLRLGYLVADAAVVKTLRDFVLPWSVNSLSQAVGVAALRDEEYLREARLVVQRERRRLTAALSGMEGLKVYAGQANFLLVRLQSGDAAQLARSLLEQGLAIRVCGDFAGLDARYFRFAVRTEPENTRLITALCQNLGGGLGCVADCPATGHPAAGRAADRRAWPSAT
ncbi:MAG: aminotransferase class I/II-fold pyridoxal phosphate-dependent enzyme, partial [Thermoleophilia bacterium]|nr:aminotransferase class I/II-fold pyridoxal phosphate-dependent enzyme [Thermoleophilia bacterium]